MDADKRCHFDINSLFSLRERVKENFFFASPLEEVSFLFIQNHNQNHNQNHISLSAIFVFHFIAMLFPRIVMPSLAYLCHILTALGLVI